MPTPPTFSVGQYNTAAYMNSIGLWLVKSQTIATSPAPTSVVVTNCFSADYDNYRIVISGGTTGSAGSVSLQLNNSTGSTYRHFGYFGSYGTATLTPYAPAFGTQWTDVGIGGTAGWMTTVEIMSPFLTKPTLATTWSTSTATVYNFALIDTSTASNTGFTLSGLGGNSLVGGTIRVYGMRN